MPGIFDNLSASARLSPVLQETLAVSSRAEDARTEYWRSSSPVPRDKELRRLAIHGSCENTAERQARITTEKLPAKQEPNMFTQAETINEAMEKIKQNFHERGSG